VEEPLETARAAVAHDLHGRWDTALADALTYRAWWLAQWPDGGAYVPGLLAQDVQEAVHAGSDPLWPLCPTCRDHALFVEPDLGEDSFWVCHRSGLPVAEVGRLPA
jgi:hypothetical protein